MSVWIKLFLSVLVLVIGAPSLPLTGGLSATAIIAALFTIWGVDQ